MALADIAQLERNHIVPVCMVTPDGVPRNAGVLVDHSGTIAVAGTAQALAAANPSRRYLLFDNIGASDLWIRFTGDASAAPGSILVSAGASFVMESSFVSPEAVSVFGQTAGSVFTCLEA